MSVPGTIASAQVVAPASALQVGPLKPRSLLPTVLCAAERPMLLPGKCRNRAYSINTVACHPLAAQAIARLSLVVTAIASDSSLVWV